MVLLTFKYFVEFFFLFLLTAFNVIVFPKHIGDIKNQFNSAFAFEALSTDTNLPLLPR